MAGRGPAPKDPAHRRRRNADPMPAVTVEPDNQLRGPELPCGVLGDEDWHPVTVEWWDTWRRSPQAQVFTETDWAMLLDTALMHHTMWTRQKLELAGEIRLRAAKFGATTEDRLRLKLQVSAPGQMPAPEPAPAAMPGKADVTDLASRRARLSG